MIDYTIEKIEKGIATIRYPDDSWAQIQLQEDMTEEDLDRLAWSYKPIVGSTPKDFLIQEGDKRTAMPPPQTTEEVYPDWWYDRKIAYGNIEGQLEFITENGLEAWQEHVAEIKKMFPKTD